MSQFFVQNPFSERTQIFRFCERSDLSLSSILQWISRNVVEMSSYSDFRFMMNGRQIRSDDDLRCRVENDSLLRILLRLKGGKGGFGSQMKKEAMAQKKITNWDLSRNLSGRRVRDVNNERKLVDFLKKQKKEDDNVEKELKDFKEMQKQQGNQNFGYQTMNNDYRERTQMMEDSISSSVLLGFEKKKKNKPTKDQDEEFQRCEDGFAIPKKIKKSQDIQGEEEIDAISEESLEKGVVPKEGDTIQADNPSHQNHIAHRIDPVEQAHKEDVQKKETVNKGKLIALGEKRDFEEIDLSQIKSVNDLVQLGDGHLKNELMRLGLKAGGRVEEKAQRLWSIKQDPQNLFNPKLMVKKN